MEPTNPFPINPPLGRSDIEVLDRRVIHDGFYRLATYHLRHRRYDGGWTGTLDREVLETDNSAAVLLYDPDLDRIILVEQFRSGLLARGSGPVWGLETAAGRHGPNEPPEDAARREALEEAGLTIKALHRLGAWLTSPGQSRERVSVFVGIVDASRIGLHGGVPAEQEDIRIVALDFSAAMANVTSMGSLVTATALFWLDRHRADLRGARAGASAQEGPSAVEGKERS